MPQIKQETLNGVAVPGLFKKSSTEGDQYRFVDSETGHRQIIHRDDATSVSAYLSGTPPYYAFDLDFRYIVGKKQLMVGIVNPTTGYVQMMMNFADIELAKSRAGWPAVPSPDIDTNTIFFYSEESDHIVRVYNMGTEKLVQFSVPHTSLPAASRSRIIVNAQGDGVAEEFLGDGDGIILRSRNGNKGLLTIDDELNIGVDPR